MVKVRTFFPNPHIFNKYSPKLFSTPYKKDVPHLKHISNSRTLAWAVIGKLFVFLLRSGLLTRILAKFSSSTLHFRSMQLYTLLAFENVIVLCAICILHHLYYLFNNCNTVSGDTCIFVTAHMPTPISFKLAPSK